MADKITREVIGNDAIDPDFVDTIAEAGADMVVVGNAIENNLELMDQLVKALHY